jgi:hypothetical protein
MHRAGQAVAEAAPQGIYRVLEGQTHMVEPDVLGPVLVEFLTG